MSLPFCILHISYLTKPYRNENVTDYTTKLFPVSQDILYLYNSTPERQTIASLAKVENFDYSGEELSPFL